MPKDQRPTLGWTKTLPDGSSKRTAGKFTNLEQWAMYMVATLLPGETVERVTVSGEEIGTLATMAAFRRAGGDPLLVRIAQTGGPTRII